MSNDILNNLSAREIVGLTIIGEARGEPIHGQVAVGSVIRNRKRSAASYTDICLAPKQFSCWNKSDPNYPVLLELGEKLLEGSKVTDPYLKQCIFVAKGIVDGDILDNTNGAVNYMRVELFNSHTVNWASNATNVSTKGNHIFFNV